MAVVIGIVVAVVLMAALFAGLRAFRSEPTPPQQTVPVRTDGGRAIITLDIVGADPSSPAVQRLVDDLAAHAFASIREAQEVEVHDQSGAVLGVRQRVKTVPGPPPDIPRDLLTPPHNPRNQRLVTEDELPDHAHPHFVASDPPGRPLADRFQLPPGVREQLRNPDDPVELVAALLATGGPPIKVDGNLIERGNDVVIVLSHKLGAPVPPEDLNHAFRLFDRTGAKHGVVVTAGHLDTHDVRRRETLAPSLLHAGADGIQRMADAAAIGADPLRFVAPVHLAVQR